jgi:hypothetical protein
VLNACLGPNIPHCLRAFLTRSIEPCYLESEPIPQGERHATVDVSDGISYLSFLYNLVYPQLLSLVKGMDDLCYKPKDYTDEIRIGETTAAKRISKRIFYRRKPSLPQSSSIFDEA